MNHLSRITFISETTDRFRRFMPRQLTGKQFVFSVALVCLIALFSLLRADFNYIDDTGRVFYGYRGWDNFSRYTSNFLSVIIHTNKVLSDISPLPQIIAIGLMAISSYLFTKLVHHQETFSISQIAGVVPLCLSPWFLECLSYKFDSPYMALSVMAALLPFTFRHSSGIQWLVAFLCAIVVCTTYQVSLSVFMISFVLVVAHKWNRGEAVRSIASQLGGIAVSFVSGVLFFKFFILNPVDSYISSSLNLSYIPRNLVNFYNTVLGDLPRLWKVLISLVACGFVITFIQSSTRPKIAALIIGLAALCGFLLCSFGLYSLLEKPLFSPRACYGFGIAIAACSVYTVASNRNLILKAPTLILAWTLFVFTFEYGNALNYQAKYTDFRVQLVINDLNDIDDFNNLPNIYLNTKGNIGKAPIIRKRIEKKSPLRRLIPSTLGSSDWMWNTFSLLHHYKLRSVKIVADNETGEEILKDNRYHTISKTGNRFFIYFKE